jgi:hypothetical protein
MPSVFFTVAAAGDADAEPPAEALAGDCEQPAIATDAAIATQSEKPERTIKKPSFTSRTGRRTAGCAGR